MGTGDTTKYTRTFPSGVTTASGTPQARSFVDTATSAAIGVLGPTDKHSAVAQAADTTVFVPAP